ncbi:hypothetical protein [Thermocatellispora tengchongensis]|uniref:hypothetical protein n=1 Tax=Thermocatellispora tengchongensis TaxID=1073253 RepID=UPI00362B28DA
MAANGAAAPSVGSCTLTPSASANAYPASPPLRAGSALRSRYGWWLISTDPTSTGAIWRSSSGPAAPASTRTFHSPASRNASSSCIRRSARSASKRLRSEASPYWRSTLSWVRRCATSASSRSVGSATTSQANGRDISVTRVDSNSVGRLISSGSGSRRPPSGGACRPGHGVHTRSARSCSHSSPIGTPRAPPGNSSGCGPAGCAPAAPASAARRGGRGGVSGPAFVISSSGVPEPRDSHPMTNARSRCAADSTAGRIVTKSHSADDVRDGAVIACTRYQGPLRGPPPSALTARDVTGDDTLDCIGLSRSVRSRSPQLPTVLRRIGDAHPH